MTDKIRPQLLFLAISLFAAAFAPGMVVAQDSDAIPIYLLQGGDSATTFNGRYVDAAGVVTAVAPAGFYLQDPAGDGRSETSDGIYVYTSSRPAVSAGECVLVRGALVSEFYEKTELSRVKSVEPSNVCRTTALHPAALPPLPYGTNRGQHFEPYEGMLVTTAPIEGIVHGPTKRFDSGESEIALVLAPIQPYIGDGRVFFDEPHEQAHLLYVSTVLGVPLPELNLGDRVRISGADGGALSAVLDYNFGKYQLLLLNGNRVERLTAREAAPARLAPAGERDFTLCSYNLKGMGRGSIQFPEPAAYARELRRRASAIAEWLAGCTVIGLQEVGAPQDADQLAALLTEEFGLPYTAVALPGPQSGNVEFPLTDALLARSDRARVVGAASPQGCSPVDYEVDDPSACAIGEHPLFDRTPLVVDLEVAGAWGAPFPLTVIVNHWKSKAGDEAVNVPRRVAQARHVAALVQTRLEQDPNAAIAVLGDLNDYYGSEPLRVAATATDPDLVHLYDWLPPLERYTYVYNGAMQALDHVLVSPRLASFVGEVGMARINADFGAPRQPSADNIHHASDHDPVLVRIWPDGTGWIAGNVRYPGVEAALVEADGSTQGTAISDARGDFRIWNVAPGSYRLALSAPPHLSLDASDVAITVVSGENRFLTTAHHLAGQIGAQIASWIAQPGSRP